ncbi:hypothetical protein ACVW0Y_003212 [Pseudomonas sp. TE3786]
MQSREKATKADSARVCRRKGVGEFKPLPMREGRSGLLGFVSRFTALKLKELAMIFFLSGVVNFLAVIYSILLCCSGLNLRIFVGREQCFMVQLLP